MPSRSEFQDSVEKAREAFRRSVDADGGRGQPLRFASDGDEPAPRPASDGQGGEPIGPQLHPFFQGLLETLPEPGDDWPQAKREQWLETARNIFALMYGDPADSRAPIRLSDVRAEQRPYDQPAAGG